MDSDQVVAKLRQHAPELRAAGVIHLRVFGSVARGEISAESDIDLLADFDKSRRLTLVTVGRLQSQLTDLLGANVDLSAEEWMKELSVNELCGRRFLPFRNAEQHLRGYPRKHP